MPCDGLIPTGLFAALLFLVDLDAELGDQHSDRLRRGSYGVSLYVNLDTQRGVRACATRFPSTISHYLEVHPSSLRFG